MGRMEKSVQGRIRRTRITKAIVGAVSIAGILAIGAVAPNAIGALGKLGLIGNRDQRRQGVKKSLARLIGAGYVALEDGKVYLTEKGEKFAALLGEGSITVRKPKRWDGKWRILMFDVPEKKKRARELVRRMLIDLGCRRIQDSVWVCPYDVEDIVMILKTDLRLGKDLLYIIADTIENDSSLRAHFGLNRA